MNFKTTVILLVVLLAAGVAIYFTRSSSTKEDAAISDATTAKLLDFTPGQVDRITITPADGKAIVLKRDGYNWQLTQPVIGPADPNVPSEMLTDLSAMTSSGKVSTGGADAAATGLSPAQYQLILDLKDGKSVKLAVGDKSGTGGQLYVQRDGQPQADLVQADIDDLLAKPVSAFRRTKLLDVQTPSIDSLTIEQPNAPAVVLNKTGGTASTATWSIVKPTSMPADTAAVSDVLASLSNLQATKFISETDPNPSRYGLSQPAVRVTFGTTQPSTTVDFGMLDVMKQNAYASTSTMPGVVQVSAYTLDSFKKSALDLRDKNLLTVDPAGISEISIQTVLPATTQPTTRAASDQTLVLQRHAAPASTMPAGTPTSKPASQWAIVSQSPTSAVDSKVAALLTAFHPLKVQRFLAAPTTMPATADHYLVKLESTPPLTSNYEIQLTDPGNSQPLQGRYNDLAFDVDRILIDQLKTDFSKADAPTPPTANPSASPTGFPGGLPPG